MKAVIVDLPGALLIARGIRWAEYFSHPTNHRGALLVVARGLGRGPSPAAAALCVVELADCLRPADGEGWAWMWHRMKPLPHLPAVNAGRGLFDVPRLAVPRGPWVTSPHPHCSLTPLLDAAFATLGQGTHHRRRKEKAA